MRFETKRADQVPGPRTGVARRTVPREEAEEEEALRAAAGSQHSTGSRGQSSVGCSRAAPGNGRWCCSDFTQYLKKWKIIPNLAFYVQLTSLSRQKKDIVRWARPQNFTFHTFFLRKALKTGDVGSGKQAWETGNFQGDREGGPGWQLLVARD